MVTGVHLPTLFFGQHERIFGSQEPQAPITSRAEQVKSIGHRCGEAVCGDESTRPITVRAVVSKLR